MTMNFITSLPLVASFAVAVATALFVHVVMGLAPRQSIGTDPVDFATEQVRVLEGTDPTHRWAGRLVAEVVPWVRRFSSASALHDIDHDLTTCGRCPPWTAERCVAVTWCWGALAAFVATVFVAALGNVVSAPLLGFGAAALVISTTLAGLHREAEERSGAVGSSLAFAADLMTLVLRAGGTPGEAFQTVAKECGGTPIGEEFCRIVEDIDRGIPRTVALKSFANRFPDPAVRDFVFSVVKGEETGTPIGSVLTAQAAELRRRKSQSCERQAAEAGVKMSFPNMLVMIACIIVILGPFLLPAVYG